MIDIHGHIWQGDYEKNKEAILRVMELYGVEKIYISGLGGYFPDPDEIEELNYEVCKFIGEANGKIGGFVYVNPAHENTMNVLKKGIFEQGMEGVKLWVATFCDDARVDPIAEFCMEHNLPLLVHAYYKAPGNLTYESTAENVRNLALRFPRLKILMAHLSANAYQGIKAIRDLPNVWVDFSGSMFRADDLDYTVSQIGVGRILFGTDIFGTFLVNVGQVLEADLSPKERQMIFRENAIRLLDRSIGV